MSRSMLTPLRALRANPLRLRAITHAASIHTTPRLAGPTKSPGVPGESDAQEDDPKQGGEGFFGTLIYGSKEAKAEGLVAGDPAHHPHSALVGRNKYIHEKITHSVPPASRDAYLSAAEKYYEALIGKGATLGGIKVMGSWENIVGDVGSFTHILEHQGYKGYDQSLRGLRRDPELSKLQSDMLAHITSRQHQLVSEFSFWPSSPPHDSGYPDGGIFEMRSYLLKPGSLLDWEYAWRQGLEARKKFVVPVGAFFSQAGLLHEVHHIWQYPDMETRKRTRDQAWTVGSWSNTVKDTVKLAYQMRSQIMVPTPFSPIK
ncbi:hypothetical protein L202_06726 [Cryptococcus amylolentus CBS 6039]|uniref:NIPSNAP domain-containing protein n=1 Tax=Cryptococcus amylolentus CBS 6039 TaxID=1295533 RepID=A0A1E3HGZ0_9TREE|nr:hypothetical protein L202_06726 [Cryptococcus amylolentus CBS 6039]ODN75607.1 hypothetical protein L202_06726 [Cryptococcus amylolentus CBS 6039]